MSKIDIEVHGSESTYVGGTIRYNDADPRTASLIIVTGEEPSIIEDELCNVCQARFGCCPQKVPIIRGTKTINALLCAPIDNAPRLCVVKSSL